MYSERPTSRRTRILWLALAWVFGGPVLVVFFFWMGWWALLLLAMAVWTTWDYLKKGDMFSTADGVSKMGAWLPGAWNRDRR